MRGSSLQQAGDVSPSTAPAPRVEAFRWRLVSPATPYARHAVLATDRLRKLIVNGLDRSTDDEDFLLDGHNANEETERRWGLHAHAHWLWTESDHLIRDLALWVPAGLSARQVRRVAAVAQLPRYPEEPRGYVGGDLHLQAIGPADVVLADLSAGNTSAVWESATPILVESRWKAGSDMSAVLMKYLSKELLHRFGLDAPKVVSLTARPTQEYFTRRWDRKFRTFPAFQIDSLTLDRPVAGPLCLGSLSHFGFGRLVCP